MRSSLTHAKVALWRRSGNGGGAATAAAAAAAATRSTHRNNNEHCTRHASRGFSSVTRGTIAASNAPSSLTASVRRRATAASGARTAATATAAAATAAAAAAAPSGRTQHTPPQTQRRAKNLAEHVTVHTALFVRAFHSSSSTAADADGGKSVASGGGSGGGGGDLFDAALDESVAVTGAADEASAKRGRKPRGGGLARAKLKQLRISPLKLNLLAAQVRNKSLNYALQQMAFAPKQKPASIVKRALESAAANAELERDLDASELRVSRVIVNQDKSLKRVRHHARGRRAIMKHRHSILRVELDSLASDPARVAKAAKRERRALLLRQQKQREEQRFIVGDADASVEERVDVVTVDDAEFGEEMSRSSGEVAKKKRFLLLQPYFS